MNLSSITPEQARNALVASRTAIGTSALLAPRFTGRLFGIDPDENPAAVFLGRLFGARELYMVAPFLMDGDDDDLHRLALRRGVAVDATDAAAATVGGFRGYLRKRTMLMAAATALAFVWLGLIATEE